MTQRFCRRRNPKVAGSRGFVSATASALSAELVEQIRQLGEPSPKYAEVD